MEAGRLTPGGPGPLNVHFDIDALMREVNRRAEKALAAGALTLANEVKKTLSVRAPTRMATSRSGVRYPVARTRAAPGAPPRLVTGRLRGSVGWQVLRQPGGPVGRVGTNLVYGRPLETWMNHKFLSATWAQVGPSVLAVMQKALGQ